jgi:hypothetical protein
MNAHPINEDKPISEIPFGIESKEPEAVQTSVRGILRFVGATYGRDITALGCTGLMVALKNQGMSSYFEQAKFVRSHMDGSGLGLPCYVPGNLYCLVHNTIGGLLVGQESQHPEGIALCSRELTEAEQIGLSVTAKALAQETPKGAMAALREGVAISPSQPPKSEESIGALDADFRCPEHTDPVWQCRYCLASAIIHGPFEPELLVESVKAAASDFNTIVQLPQSLEDENVKQVLLYARVAKWSRRMVKE